MDVSKEPLKARLLFVGLVVFFLQSCGVSTNPARRYTRPTPTIALGASENTGPLPASKATEPEGRYAIIADTACYQHRGI